MKWGFNQKRTIPQSEWHIYPLFNIKCCECLIDELMVIFMIGNDDS